MVRLLGYSAPIEVDAGEAPREIVKAPSASGDNGWLIRFFDSAFFCEWIAVSYLYKHEHSGVRDYLCNKMYNLPMAGVESYLFQLCFMLVQKSSPALDKFMADMCSKSLRMALKVHWFLLAEAEETGETEELKRLQEKCQMAALMGDWPPLVRPKKTETSPSSKSRIFKVLSSRRILNLSALPPSQKTSSPVSSPTPITEEETRSPLEESESSLKVLKKLVPGPKVRDAFFKKFRDKEEEEGERPKESESDSFFRRLLRDKDDDEKGVRSEELPNSDNFFRRLFRDKLDTEEKVGGKVVEEEGFFRRLFRDKTDDRDREDDRDRPDDDEKGHNSCDEEESSEFSFFRRFIRIHPDDEDKSLLNAAEAPTPSTPENSPGTAGFFKRLFRDRGIEDSKIFSLRREDGSSPSSFLRKLFKDRIDEFGGIGFEDKGKMATGDDLMIVENGTGEQHKMAFREVHSNNLNGMHEPAILATQDHVQKSADFSSMENRAMGAVPTTIGRRENSSGVNVRLLSAEESPADPGNCKDPQFSDTNADVHARLFTKRPGSPKQRSEKSSAKPPLPNYSSFYLRKGAYHATLDFVRSLCDISSGLVDVFPMEDRRKSLHESLVELNTHLAIAQNDGGVCFPMGKSICRVVHIPEDEAALLNSREKAPYLICVEVVKSDEQSAYKVHKDSGSYKPSRGGIPLANGDVQLQRPPPWAYPLWNQSNTHQNNSDRMLRAASQAIDRAMTHLWETKVKFVHLSLSVTQKSIDAQDCPADHVSVSRNTILAQFNEETEFRKIQSDVEGTVNDASLSGGFRDATDRIDQIGMEVCQNVEGEGSGLVENCSNGEGRSAEGSTGAGWTQANCEAKRWKVEWVSVLLTAVPGVNMEDVEDEEPTRRKDHRRVPSTIAMAQVKAAAAKEGAPPGLPVKKSSTGAAQAQSEDIAGRNANDSNALAGELWEKKKERLRITSKFGNIPGWDLCSVIVKSGDDCRQEHLAVQLISHFYDIFQEAGLPLWLRPYEVLVTSSYTALIETIPDTASIHAIKSRNPNLSSLREFFCNKYEENSPAFKLAQRNFVESMAAYSILCYFLQVKDRHNGNLLIDEDGHIIHIDFGFMLSNSPGGVNFESAPFKLTRELLEVMDSDAEGTASEFFDYFKVLCIQGFLTCRKHAERIILLVEMMQDAGFPCFKGGPKTILNLRKRFHLTLTEEQCVSLVLSLISSSLDAWRTRQYDYYQRVLNGIL